MEHKPHDPQRAPLIRQMFELAATGEWSLADLARWSIGQGFTMPPVRRRRTLDEILAEEEDDARLDIQPASRLPTFNSIHKILTNPTYAGKTLNDEGVWVPSASLEAIVPPELFDRVQTQLRERNKSAHYVELMDHPLRRLIRCGACWRVYTPYVHKGITYYGARCDRSCTNTAKSTNFEVVSRKIGVLIHNLSFTADELAEIDARTSTGIALLDNKRMSDLESAERRKKQLREELAYLNANRLPLLRAGAYTPESIVAEETRLTIELEALKQAEDVSDTSMRETVRDVLKLSELLKSGGAYYDLANPQEKDRIIRVIFSELTLVGNTLEYKCKKGFAALQNRFVVSGDPTSWLSELQREHSYIVASIDVLKTTLAASELPSNVVIFPGRRRNSGDDRAEPLAA